MKASAVILHECGGPDVLTLETIDVPDPAPGEIRIKVEAFGLNRSEAMFREGWHPVKPVLPSRIGYEAAGVVESVGAGVEGLAVGDKVVTLPTMETNKCGAHGAAMTLPAELVAPWPPELDAAEAASLYSSYITAYGGLVELVSVKPGDFVLVTAASSSVGPPAIQILNMLGAKPIAVTTKRAKADAIRALGPHDVIVTEDENLVDRVTQITGGKGVSVVFDPVGGPAVMDLAQVTAPYGTLIMYGVLDFNPAPLPLQFLVEKNLSILGYAMYLEDNPERNARALAFIREGVAKGSLRPLVGERFTLDQIVEAAHYLDSMQQIGKVVVMVE